MTSLRARNARWVAVFVGSALGLAASGHSQVPPVTRPAVVIELFTSQGCSSCPPADELLGRLGADPALQGRIVPLAFHVDYWDSLGWKDPYSSAAWSTRQSEYARAFQNGRIYTPQAVFAGRTECVGSEERAVRERIDEAEHRPVGAIDLRLGSGLTGQQITISAAPPKGFDGDLAVMVAVYSRSTSTEVARGENAHRRLRNDFVVRRLAPVFTLAAGSAATQRTLPLALDSTWGRGGLGVAVFLQDPASREIFGGRAIDLPVDFE